jgi:diaminopimelate decarboxylase
MHDFAYRNGEFYCEDVPLSRIAKECGTPFYVYSHATLVRHFRALDSAFQHVPHIIAFAMKANSNLAILRLLAREGSGADICTARSRPACLRRRSSSPASARTVRRSGMR